MSARISTRMSAGAATRPWVKKMAGAVHIAALVTPVGQLGLVEEDGAIIKVIWGAEDRGPRTALLNKALRQLADYFDGKLERFDLPLRVAGSDFQRAVCDAMLAIPFGETLTYGDIAQQVGASAQAVGNACGANPIPVIIPCHRVLGASSLGGFSGDGGVETKVALLRHEGAAGLLI
ncbi:Methylated-DNA--protein-cysteine methyltransferase [Actibacterium lipolyticum]|uniref:Methylated-DNA--protein-cysteine methyltransferase n=2 Tax=Actibacterium lipolyticum TaxID=1524263 RepID=A0A238KND2_9RHOB|nr:Methylated-DNA--protein-cysteine methyltransferase [Actibacterium lipolyticum]